MPRPIQNSINLNFHVGTQPEGSQATASHSVAKPGAGVVTVKGEQMSMSPLCQSGFISAFSTQLTSLLAHQGRLPIASSRSQEVLSDSGRLSQKAARDMLAISELDLNSLNSTKENIADISKQQMSFRSITEKNAILAALTDYQGSHGDNYLMNVSAMGYKSIEIYLHSLGISSPHEIKNFIEYFNFRYDQEENSPLTDYDIGAFKRRIEDELAIPTSILKNHIHASPRISGIHLLKGSAGHDEVSSTQINGADTIISALNGQSIYFNGFLSTTTSFETALEFAGLDDIKDLGDPIFTVDLNDRSEEAEILRRKALTIVQNNECGTGAILYYFKANNIAAISVNATKEIARPGLYYNHLNIEDEILANPDHFVQPEQIVLYSRAAAIIGSLSYSKG